MPWDSVANRNCGFKMQELVQILHCARPAVGPHPPQKDPYGPCPLMPCLPACLHASRSAARARHDGGASPSAPPCARRQLEADRLGKPLHHFVDVRDRLPSVDQSRAHGSAIAATQPPSEPRPGLGSVSAMASTRPAERDFGKMARLVKAAPRRRPADGPGKAWRAQQSRPRSSARRVDAASALRH